MPPLAANSSSEDASPLGTGSGLEVGVGDGVSVGVGAGVGVGNTAGSVSVIVTVPVDLVVPSDAVNLKESLVADPGAAM